MRKVCFAAIVTFEGDGMAERDHVVRCGRRRQLGRADSFGVVAHVAHGKRRLPPPLIDVFQRVRRLEGFSRLGQIILQHTEARLRDEGDPIGDRTSGQNGLRCGLGTLFFDKRHAQWIGLLSGLSELG